MLNWYQHSFYFHQNISLAQIMSPENVKQRGLQKVLAHVMKIAKVWTINRDFAEC